MSAVIDHLINNLVKGPVDGLRCVDALGEQIKVLFDKLETIGDYHGIHSDSQSGGPDCYSSMITL